LDEGQEVEIQNFVQKSLELLSTLYEWSSFQDQLQHLPRILDRVFTLKRPELVFLLCEKLSSQHQFYSFFHTHLAKYQQHFHYFFFFSSHVLLLNRYFDLVAPINPKLVVQALAKLGINFRKVSGATTKFISGTNLTQVLLSNVTDYAKRGNAVEDSILWMTLESLEWITIDLGRTQQALQSLLKHFESAPADQRTDVFGSLHAVALRVFLGVVFLQNSKQLLNEHSRVMDLIQTYPDNVHVLRVANRFIELVERFFFFFPLVSFFLLMRLLPMRCAVVQRLRR
jgi:hypothetical protein